MQPFSYDISVIIVATGSILAQLFIMLTAWFKFKAEIARKTNEIKYHSDVSVQKLNGMLTSVIMSFDRPAWVKVAYIQNDKVVFRMLEMNEKYGELFAIKRTDYIGKTDLEAGWPREVAQELYDHDIQVWSTGEPRSFEETLNGKRWRFRKVRVVSQDGKIKGVMGYAVDCEAPHDCPFHNMSSKNVEKVVDNLE